MGKRSQGYRRALRDGKTHWIVDFLFINKEGKRERYRRDAALQTAAGAHAEADRRKRMALETGSPYERALSPTFEAFVRGDFSKLVLVRFKPLTREGYEDMLYQPKHGLVALLGGKRLDTIDPVREQRILEAEALSRGAKPRYSCTLFHTVMREAYVLGVLEHPPKLAKLPARASKLPMAPPEQDVVRVFAEARGWHRVALALVILAGLRDGEVRALQVRDVDLVHDLVYVRRAYSGSVLMPETKGREEDIVPLATVLKAILAEEIEGRGPTEPVLLTGRGGPPGRGSTDTALRAIQARLGIEPCWSMHKFRHYFASELARQRVNVEVLRRLLRHRHLGSTARYLHATASDTVAAIASLPSPAGNGQKPHDPSLK